MPDFDVCITSSEKNPFSRINNSNKPPDLNYKQFNHLKQLYSIFQSQTNEQKIYNSRDGHSEKFEKYVKDLEQIKANSHGKLSTEEAVEQLLISKDTINSLVNDTDPTNALQDGKIGTFQQGSVDDCWFLAYLSNLSQSKEGASLIKKMIKDNGSGNYTVNFANGFKADVSKKDLEDGYMKNLDGNPVLYGGEKQFYSSGDKDVRILEIAMNKALLATSEHNINGGQEFKTDAQQFFLNKPMDEEMHMIDLMKNPDEFLDSIEAGKATASTRMPIVSDKENNEKLKELLKNGFFENHMYNIKSIDKKKKTIELENPHDTSFSTKISYEKFKSYFERVYKYEIAPTDKCSEKSA